MQSALAQLGLTETAARGLLLEEVRARGAGKSVTAGRAAYQKVPEAVRGPVTTALFAWAKAYVDTPAFEAEYARIRAAATPQLRRYERTIDEELKKQLDEQLAALEGMKAAAASMPPADAQKFLAGMKQSIDNLRSPETQNALRARLEAERATSTADDDKAVAEWQEHFPTDRQAFFARRLREFLDATADVDFGAIRRPVRNLAGQTVGFEVRDEHRTKPWQWLEAYLVGKDATTAARAAATAWLKEMGK
jgi:hypothetical protein